MPELPEVESVRRRLTEALVGKSLISCQSLFPGVLSFHSPHSPPCFPTAFIRSHRKGKVMAFEFEDEQYLVVHLRMTGAFYFPQNEKQLESHTHVLFQISDDIHLAYRDPRRFGRLWWYKDARLCDVPQWAKLGPDALLVGQDDFVEKIRGHKRMMKPLLLDQTVISGLGNIYVDESLFASGIHPRQSSHTVSKDRLRNLWDEVRQILSESILRGGSTIRDFVDVEGKPGNYQDNHLVYGHAGEACPKCGRTLKKILVGQRGTSFCPKCQPMRYPRRRKGKAG